MTDAEMVEMYRVAVFHYEQCIEENGVNGERLKNFKDLYRVVFSSNGVTSEQVAQAASRYAKTIADKLFESMFETEEDRLVFCLKCAPSNPVWLQNGYNKLFGHLQINGHKTIEDKPMCILIMDDTAQISWGSNGIPNRDRTFGPAIVDVKANKSFVGHHVMSGARVAGLSRWRKRCSQHNLWMRHLT